MVNKLFIASTTRNKMPPRKARGRLKQSEVFFPLTYHAIFANHVVQPGICPFLIQNRPGFRSCHLHLRWKVWTKSTLFVSINSISKEYSTTHYKRLHGLVKDWGQPANAINGHRFDYDCDYITRSTRLVLPRANSKVRWRKNIRIREKIIYTTKLSGFKCFSIQSSHFKFRIQNL